MEKKSFYKKKRKKLIDSFFERGMPENLAKTLFLIDSIDEEETEDYDYLVYEYIDLVYPPNSKPPTRNSMDINLLNFNQFHQRIF